MNIERYVKTASYLITYLHLEANPKNVRPCKVRIEDDNREYYALLFDNKLLCILNPDDAAVKRFIALRSDRKLSFCLFLEDKTGLRRVDKDEALNIVMRRAEMPRNVKFIWITVLFNFDSIPKLFESFNSILLGEDIKLIL